MKRAIVLKPFQDLVEGVARIPGDFFDVKDERAEFLESLGLVKAEDKPRASKKPAKIKEA